MEKESPARTRMQGNTPRALVLENAADKHAAALRAEATSAD